MVKPIFTTIIYQTKDKLKLSIVEYCLVDIIGRLSNSPEYPYCLLSQEELAKNLGISTRQTIRLIKKLLGLGYLEQEPTIKKLRVTQKWINNTDLNKSDKMSDDMTKCHTDSDKMSDQPYDKMSHYNNSINKDNNNIIPLNSPLEEIKLYDLEEIANKYQIPLSFVKMQLESLKNYCASNGKKYKDYKAALRNFCLRDMKNMATRQQRGGVLDATNI